MRHGRRDRCLRVDGSQLVNGGAAPQSVTQTLPAPAGYLYCLSATLRAAQPGTVTLLAGAQRSTRVVNTVWSRVALAAECDPVFGLELPAGTTVEVKDLQVEPQGGASIYKPSTRGGVYRGCAVSRRRFDDYGDRREPARGDGEHHPCKPSLS